MSPLGILFKLRTRELLCLEGKGNQALEQKGNSTTSQTLYRRVLQQTDYVAVVKGGKVQLKEFMYENDGFGELQDRDVAT